MPTTPTPDTLICVGAIMGAFGVKGEVRLKSFCAVPGDIDTYGPLYSEDGKTTYDLSLTANVKGGFSGRIKSIRYRDQAEALRGTKLYVPREALPSLPDDEFYYSDLIGLEVFDTGGEKIGKVKAVHDHGAGDVLELHTKHPQGAMLPFTRAVVPTVDLAQGRIIADPPEGALPE